MGIFDRFKKQPEGEAAGQKKPPVLPAAPIPTPTPRAPEPAAPAPLPRPIRPAAPDRGEQAPPAPVKVNAQPRRDPAPGSSGGAKPAQTGAKAGASVAELVSAQIKVFVTADFVRSDAFPRFAREWHENRAGAYVTRFYFLPDCEKLTEQERSRIDSSDCRTRGGDTPEACMAAMAAQGLRWSIALLTASSQTGYPWFQAAKAHGIFLRWYGLDGEGRLCTLQQKQEARQPAPAEPMRFPHARTQAPIRRVQPYPGQVPAAGGTVYLRKAGGSVTLGKPVMSDHRSITYTTSAPDRYAKIYTSAALLLDCFENKLERMLRDPVSLPGVCWPEDILQDASGRFVGALVPASRGVQLTASVLNGRTGLARYFPGWDKRDLCRLTLTILQKIARLEALGLLYGCLNPAAIYVEDPDTVFFVDMDGWQIEGYPSLSRNRTFTAPESLKAEKPPLLSDPDLERYQTAVLTFLLLMPGKFPYAKRKSTDDTDSIVSMSFPFTIDGDRQRSRDAEHPSGVWRIVWDHLSYPLCLQFYNSFHAAGKNSRPGTRVPTAEWIRLVSGYAKLLEGPDRVDSRPMFPPTFRRDGKRVFARCSICGQEHPQSYFLRSIYINQERVDLWARGYRVCLPCADGKSDMSFTCECCGETYYYTNRTKILHEIGRADFDFKAQRWCRNCKKRTAVCPVCGRTVPLLQMAEYTDRRRNQKRTMCFSCRTKAIDAERQWRDAPRETRYCKTCGRPFIITNGEYEYYSARGLSLPTRCKACRGNR